MTDEKQEIAALRDYNRRLKERVKYLELRSTEPDTIDAIAADYRKFGYTSDGEPAYSWTVELVKRQHKTVASLQDIACCNHRGIVVVALHEAERYGLKAWTQEKELEELNKWLKSIIGDCD